MSTGNTTGAAPPLDEGPKDVDSSAIVGDNEQRARTLELPLGEALTIAESLPITLARRTQLIVVAGAVGSGKTTLIASLFHLFQRGPFAGYLFAGSDTLIGFDRRCHLARIASGAATADTERTKRGVDRQFLHLRVRKEDCETPPRDLLISDLSGEDYRDAKDSIDECRRLPLLRRADHFLVLVDSVQLAQLDSRQRAKNEAAMLLRSCIDAEQLGIHSMVDLLCTKWDLVEQGDEAGTVAFVEDFQRYMSEQYVPKLNRLRFSRIAARPTTPGFALGYGLAELFPAWVEEVDLGPTVLAGAETPIDLTSEFDRFVFCHPRCDEVGR